jgi:uncharacterized repeat protein (TIGR01451 family)
MNAKFEVSHGGTCAWLAAIACLNLLPAQAGSFSTNFAAGVPAGSTVFGSAAVADGALKLTTAVNNQTGSLILDDLDSGEFVKAFNANFRLKIGGGSGAGGVSFTFGPLIPDAAFGNEGSADRGLVISFDTYDNGGGEAPAIDVIRGGFVIASYKTNVLALLRTNDFQQVSIVTDAEGRLTLTVAGTTVFQNLRGAYVPSAGRFGLGAATSGLNDNHWIDDLSISTTAAEVGDFFTVENEMFDTAGGGGVASVSTVPYAGSEYAGLSAVHDVDYHEDTNNGVENNYRTTESPNVPMLADVGVAPWTRRPGFAVTSNHRVGYVGGSEWYHYTRTIPAGHYRVVFSASHAGTGSADIRSRFHVLYDGHGTDQPRLWDVGGISGYGSGAWARNHALSVKRPDGSGAVIGLPGGPVTLRHAPQSGDADWFMLVPVSVPEPQADLLVRNGTSGLFAGDNLFQSQPSGVQVVDATAVSWASNLFEIKVSNDSPVARTLLVRALENHPTGWTIGSRVGATDIKNALFGVSGYTTAELAPGASEMITVEILPSAAVPPGMLKRLTFGVFDGSEVTTPRDTVRIESAVAGLVAGRQGQGFACQAPGPAGSTWSATGLPLGLEIATGTGQITGTPSQAGSYEVQVTASHPQGSTQRTLRIVVGRPIPTDGLLSGWQAEGGGGDSFGPNPGSLQGGMGFVEGPLGQAFSFDGSDDSVDLGSWFNLQAFTIACWVKPDSSQNTYADIMDNNHTGYRSWVFQYSNTADLFGTDWTMGFYNIGYAAYKLAHQTWQHFAVTLDGTGGAKYYLNGRLIGSNSTANQIGYDGSQFFRLGRWGGGGRHFRGALDDVLVYTRALDGAEVVALVNSPAPTTYGAQAEMLVRSGTGGTYLGEDVFELVPSAAQTAVGEANPALPAVFQVLVRNDAPYVRSLNVRVIAEAASGWSFVAQAGTTDITPDLAGPAGHTTAPLAPGASETIALELTPTRLVPIGSTRSLSLQVLDGGIVNAPLDSVRVAATAAGLVRPDLLVSRAVDGIEAGDDIYNTNAAGQRQRQRVALESSASYRLRITNDGNGSERFVMRGPAAPAGWSALYQFERRYASFDGNDDHINLGAWGPGTQWTTEAWVKPSALPAGRHSIIGGFNEARDWGITLQEGRFGVAFKPVSGAATLTELAPDSAVTGEWIHVAGTCDGTTARLFLNGVEAASGLVQAGYVGTTAGTRIGGESCCGSNGFPGLIRDVRVWNYPRSAAEIAAAMHADLSGAEAGLLGYWRLDEETGSAVADLGPNARHGSFANGAGWLLVSENVTAAVTGSGFITPVVAPAATTGRLLNILVTPSSSVADGASLDLLVTGTANGDPSKTDAVRVVTHASGPAVGGVPVSGSYSTDADFEFGIMTGVENGSVADQLQLSLEGAALHYLWVPNSNEGTISKVDTRDGRELARYRVCPSTVYGNPSRTTIDQIGNCWVGNRRTGTVVKVGLLENGQWIDRNQNGAPDTSRDTNHDGVITGSEVLPWGTDECVLVETVLIPGKEGHFAPGAFTSGYANDDWNPGPRSLAVDGGGNLWVGSWGLRKFHYLDGDNGEIHRSVDVSTVNHTPYGALIDGQGILWSSSQDKAHILRLDPATDTFSTVVLPTQLYGLGIDADNHLFASGWQSSKLYRVDVLSGVLEWARPGSYESRGVAVTKDGDVWTADSSPGTVTRFSNNGAVKASIKVGATPTGVAVDGAGKLWVVHYGDDTVRRIDPATNTVDMVKSLPGTAHYGYSDMTGIVARNATTRFGYWSVIHDSKVAHSVWTAVEWTGSEPAPGGLVVMVRSSEDGVSWSPWEIATDGGLLATTPPGRYLEIKVEFRAAAGAASPVLQDIAAHASAPGDTDLAVAKVCLTSNPRAEHELIYQVTVTNQGTEWASGAVVTDTLPAGFELVAADTPGGAHQSSGGVLTVSYAGIAPGESRVFTVSGLPWTPGANSNRAVVAFDRVDTDPSDNEVTLVTQVAPLECLPPPPSLLAWWPGNGSGQELVAGRQVGDWNGAGFATGRVGLGFRTDGNDDYFELGNAGMIHSDRGVTVAGWFKADSFHRTWQCVYYKGNPLENGPGNDNRETSLFLNSAGYLHFNSTTADRVGTGQWYLDSPSVIEAGKWYHFATVADCERGVMEIWLNGERVAWQAYPRTAVRTTDGPFRIGVNVPGGELFRGVIDDIAVFGRGLPPSEIASLYDVRSAGMCADLPVIAAPVTLFPGSTGVYYSQTFAANFGVPPYTWSLALGSLPVGLTLSPAGTLSGTPLAAGTHSLKVRVTDSNAQTAERDYTLGVGSCLTPGAGMTALWSGEGNGDDSIGANHGTVGPMTYYVQGVKGSAFHFIDNSQSYVNFPNTPALQVPASDPQFTIEAWIKPDFNVTGNKLDTILAKRDGCGGNFTYQFGVMKGHSGYPVGILYLSMSGLPNSTVFSNAVVPDDGRFHHVAVTYKHDKPADNIIFYLDGNEVGTLTTTVIPPVTSEGPTAGRHASCGYYSTATIDEIAFHQAELSAAQIEARVTAGSAGYCDPPDADLLVKTSTEGDAGFLANDFRETLAPAVQVKSMNVAPSVAAEFQVKVENDSSVPRSFVLRAMESGSDGWTRGYEGAGGNIGPMLKSAGGYETAMLAPGGAELITVRLTPGNAVSGGFTMKSTVSVHRDSTAQGARDSVQVQATCAEVALADMLVRRASDFSFLGDDIRNQDGTSQGKTSEIAAGQSANFFARISNDGNVPTRFRLRTTAPAGGWTLHCSGPEPGLNFDGVNDAVRVPDAPALRPPSLTLEGWFLATVTSGARTFVAKGFGTQDWDSYVIWIDNGTLWAGVMDHTGRIDRLPFNWNSLPAGWHHVAMTFDDAADDLRLFVDGVERGRMTSTLAIVYDAHPLTIGCDTSGTSYLYPMAGQAREVRLWNLARTPAEVQATMTASLTGGEAGLAGLWPLTEGAGRVANDLAGGHHGELINGASWLFTGLVDLTNEAASPAGWSDVVLSPGQSYDLGVSLVSAAGLPAGNRCDVWVTGANISGIPATSDVVRLSGLIPESSSSGEPAGRTFTSDEDFDNSQSTLVGVEFNSVPNQLQLGRTQSALPFLWVPNSNQGTISKVDTRTGRELGRYRVCPESVASYANPSRTTVDLYGHCWVGNRQIGSAVKVGLYESGGHVDRNGDGIIQTSVDTNDNGIIDGTELLPWGADECVLWEVIVIPGKEGTFAPGTYTAGYANDYWNPGPRGIAIDAAGDLWLGSFGIRKYHKIDGDSGAILSVVDVSPVNHTPYGAVIDRNGILWSSGSDKQHVLRLDPQTETFEAIPLGHHSYGMALDNAGHLFVSGWENTKLSRIDIATGVKEWTLNGVYQSRGVAVTPDGDVWTANSGPGTVTRFSNDGAIKTTIEVGNQPTGVAVDADGKVWAVNVGDEYVKRIDPATNAVDLAKALPGTNHYGYSDMTGIVARNATTRFGTWTVIQDSGMAGTMWQSVGWNSLEPEGQGLTVRVRTSGDGANWSAWSPAINGGSLAGLPAGRYLQVETFFQVVTTVSGEQSPVLYDLTITPDAAGAQKLTVSLGVGNTIILSALGSPDDWVLERSTTLQPDGWQDLPFVPQLVPGGFTITVERDAPRAFFRLRRK